MKKKTLIISAALAGALIAVCVFIRLNYQEQICVNGTVYTQKGDNVSALPDNSVKIGSLERVIHRSTEMPRENMTATNVDEKYAGCPIYRSGDTVLLEDYSGFYIPFEK